MAKTTGKLSFNYSGGNLEANLVWLKLLYIIRIINIRLNLFNSINYSRSRRGSRTWQQIPPLNTLPTANLKTYDTSWQKPTCLRLTKWQFWGDSSEGLFTLDVCTKNLRLESLNNDEWWVQDSDITKIILIYYATSEYNEFLFISYKICSISWGGRQQ